MCQTKQGVPSPGGILFFVCPKKRIKRNGSPSAETAPVVELRNRRGKNSLRSNSSPLISGSAPRRTAQRRWHPSSPDNPFQKKSIFCRDGLALIPLAPGRGTARRALAGSHPVLIYPLIPDIAIEETKIPFSCVATDIRNGKRVVITDPKQINDPLSEALAAVASEVSKLKDRVRQLEGTGSFEPPSASLQRIIEDIDYQI
mgnify:CR=1 FL=1